MSQIETCVLPRPSGGGNAPEEAELLPEKFSALLRQIGSPDGFPEASVLQSPLGGTGGGRGLRDFLESYQARVLEPLEMPAIARAHFVSARGHVRELIALDRQLGGEPLRPALASASRRIGRAQLERLRPLRDERVVRRYLAAVEAGEAGGWHTVVYGLTLAVYSWPLRQGLHTYARETLSGLARAATRSSGFPEAACREILRTFFLRLPAAIEQTVAGCEEWAGPLKGL
jgi:urease accessory protein UreF